MDLHGLLQNLSYLAVAVVVVVVVVVVVEVEGEGELSVLNQPNFSLNFVIHICTSI
jgi:hypothetical protein